MAKVGNGATAGPRESGVNKLETPLVGLGSALTRENCLSCFTLVAYMCLYMIGIQQ